MTECSPHTVKSLLDQIQQLPALPAIVQEVIASFSNADPDTVWLSGKIAQDIGLSAKVLRVANSSFYGLPRKVGSIQDAVTVLGFNSVRTLALSAGMMHAFPSVPGSLFDRKVYWQRSFRVAAYAKELARCLKSDQATAFTAGMFHDIGQLLMDLCFPARYDDVLRLSAGRDLFEVERTLIGWDHAQLGGEAVRHWNFPHQIEQAVRYCHQPEQLEPYDPMVCIVHMAFLLESGVSGAELLASMPQSIKERTQMTWERIEACLPTPDQLQAAADLAQT